MLPLREHKIRSMVDQWGQTRLILVVFEALMFAVFRETGASKAAFSSADVERI